MRSQVGLSWGSKHITIGYMQKRSSISPLFFIFLGIALLIFFFLSKHLGFIEFLTRPVQKTTFSALHGKKDAPTEIEKLRAEKNSLLMQVAKEKELEKENQALRDQFQTEKPSSRTLLPARVIGASENEIILDKGESDGVKLGDVIVVKDNLIGKITKTSSHIAAVSLIAHNKTVFTAQTVKTSAIGVVNGAGGGKMTFVSDLSEELEREDLIRTKGDVDGKDSGFPPNLVVGQIISVNKKSSALFQVAEVKSLVDFSRLEIVFVMTGN